MKCLVPTYLITFGKNQTFCQKKTETVDILMDYIKTRIGCEKMLLKEETALRSTLGSFSIAVSRKWKENRRFIKQFLETNNIWLKEVVVTSGTIPNFEEPSTSSRGRASANFLSSSRRTKQRKVNKLVSAYSPEELAFALEVSLHKSGKRDTADVVRGVVSSPKRAKKLKTLEKKNVEGKKSFSPEEALALFIQLKLTRQQYIELRTAIKTKTNDHLLPSYHELISQKKKCYPAAESILVSDTSAEVKLQDLLDHTAERLIESQQEAVQVFLGKTKLESSSKINLQLDCKWGADGSGCQSNYKQKFDSEGCDDSNILTTSLVPIQLYYSDGNRRIFLWNNMRTSSTRFCRPIKIQFTKETNDVINREFGLIEEQIEKLVQTKIDYDDKQFLVSHNLFKTMVDGKVCNSLTSNSSTQKCYICKSGPKEFNDLELITKKFTTNTDTLDFGLSSLHAYIRFFEALLHIAYRTDFKTWQVRGENNKTLFSAKKQYIISKFKSEMGLLVDVPKPGFGSSNDGNTARRFFQNPELSSLITGIDTTLIYRFGIILNTLSCGFAIDPDKFQTFSNETAKLYIQLYSWYPMPVTLHKILIHGSEIIKNFVIPIGQLSEDVQESQHKNFRYYREHNTRKISRKATNEDLLHILLASSDPLISSIRPLPIKTSKTFNSDVINLLKSPSVDEDVDVDEDDDDNDQCNT